MTQNYARPMHAMPPGMPVIPPRMQQQQQQELIQQHRRQQHMQMQQMQHMQQRQQMQGMNHARSVSSGSNRTDPRPLNTKASSGSLTTNGRRLRSESNPAHSSHHQRNPSSGTSASQGLYINTSAFVVGHSRTKSNSDNSNSNSNSSGTNSGSPRSQSRALADSPSTATATRSNTTGSSFQERMRERDREKQQREREERDAAARAILDDPKLSATLLNQPTSTTTAAAMAQSTGTAIWNRLRAAKDVINATITGEERWPDSDDSDHEGESHVSRMLREYADKKEAAEVAAKIAELEMTPISSAPSPPVSASGSLSKSLSNRGIHRRPPDTTRYDNGALNNRTLRSSPSATSLRGDYYGQSLRSRGETGYQPALSEDGSRSAPTSTNSRTNTLSNNNDTTNSISLGRSESGRNGSTSTLTKSKSSGGPVGSNKLGNRFRTSSDASLSEALGRLEGKRNQDALVAQVSHLGSTRARSPHRGNRAHLDNVDEVPPPPLPTPKSSFRQHAQNSEQLLHSSPSRRAGAGALASGGSNNNNNNNADLGAYGQHLLQLQQKQ